MASKPETTFSRAVNKHLRLDLHKEKMSNPYRGGTADYWYSGNKGDLWVEYKWLPKAPRSTFSLVTGKKPALSALQQKWLRERGDEGRNVAVIVGCPTGTIILRNRDWEQSVNSDFVITRQQTAEWITKETQHAVQNENSRHRSKSDNTDV
jgi:hypothetical protein